jgi:hypothetical protein
MTRYLHNGWRHDRRNGGAIPAGRRHIVISATAKSGTELDIAILVDGAKRCEQRGLAMLIGQACFRNRRRN